MRYKRLATILIPIFTVLALPLAAPAGGPTGTLTLEESIAIALKENLSIRSVREGVLVSEARKKEAFTGFLPKLSTTYNYTRNDPAPYINQPPPSPVNSLTVGTRDNYTWSLDARQPLFAGGRISGNYDISRLGERASRMDELSTVQGVVAQVTAGYFDILKARRLKRVAEQSVELLAAQLDLVKNFHEVGLVPRNEVLQSEVRLANGRQILVRAENNVELARARFNTILRRPSTSPVEVEDILRHTPYEKSLDECLAAARDRRPDVEASAVRHEQARMKVQVVQSDYYPSVNLVGSYTRYGDEPGLNGSVYKDPEGWLVAAVASWDFWEWGRTKHASDAARGQAEQARIALEGLKDQVALEVEQAFLALREAEKRISLAGKAVEQAEENYRINQERYRLQVSRVTDLLDAETLLTTSRAELAVALGDYQIAKAGLERAMGVNWAPGGGWGPPGAAAEKARAEND